MKLSDIMSSMNLASYAEVAMAIFLVVFIGATIWAYLPSNRNRFSLALNMPMEDGIAVSTRHTFDADTLAIAGTKNDEALQ